MILKACTVCGRLSPSHRCDTHKQKDRRPNAHRRGYDTRWNTFRARYVADHPYCEDSQGCNQPTTDVHHLDGKGPKGPRGLDPSNCQALCHSHHSQRTADLQPGGFHA